MKLFIHLNYFEQRDILTILAGLFALDTQGENILEKWFEQLIFSSDVAQDEIFQLQIQIQNDNVRSYYEKIIIDDMSIICQKYLNLLLAYIAQNTKINIYKEKINDLSAVFIYEQSIENIIYDNALSYFDSTNKRSHKLYNILHIAILKQTRA